MKGSIMTETISPIQPFTTIKYTTKDGENITATKKDGIVTLNGDKNGIRQMPLEDFKKELLTNLPQTTLEKTPQKDTVEISTKTEESKNSPKVETKTPESAKAETTETPKKLDTTV